MIAESVIRAGNSGMILGTVIGGSATLATILSGSIPMKSRKSNAITGGSLIAGAGVAAASFGTVAGLVNRFGGAGISPEIYAFGKNAISSVGSLAVITGVGLLLVGFTNSQ